MNLQVEAYTEQLARWPKEGRHILAQYDNSSIIVYQAYRPSIGLFAVEKGYFGGEFSYSRMSWVKTNFLWMMYRSLWCTAKGQEVVLAVRLRREGFDSLLEKAVHSTFTPEAYTGREEWREKLNTSEVRLQWDPDHDPYGEKVARRAIQLGLRGGALESYGRDWIVSIENISDFVREQREAIAARGLDKLVMPRERVYPVTDSALARRLGISEAAVN